MKKAAFLLGVPIFIALVVYSLISSNSVNEEYNNLIQNKRSMERSKISEQISKVELMEAIANGEAAMITLKNETDGDAIFVLFKSDGNEEFGRYKIGSHKKEEIDLFAGTYYLRAATENEEDGVTKSENFSLDKNSVKDAAIILKPTANDNQSSRYEFEYVKFTNFDILHNY